MADSDRIVYPDEVEEVKEEAAKEAERTAEESSTVETPAIVGVSMRNMISVPANCPAGYQMGADGVCREVFN